MVAFEHIPLWIPAPPYNQQGQNLCFHGFQASFCSVSPKRLQGLFRLAINITKENILNTLKLLPVVLTSGNAPVEKKTFSTGQVSVQAAGSAARSQSQLSSQRQRQQEPEQQRSQRKSGRTKASLQAARSQSGLGWGEVRCFFNTILLSQRVDAAVYLCQNHPTGTIYSLRHITHWVTQGCCEILWLSRFLAGSNHSTAVPENL